MFILERVLARMRSSKKNSVFVKGSRPKPLSVETLKEAERNEGGLTADWETLVWRHIAIPEDGLHQEKVG